jgi:hypothetical protein
MSARYRGKKSRKFQKSRNQQPRQSQPSPAKKPSTRIPPPQAERIKAKYIFGESIRKISRDEKRDRETITRIVRGSEVLLYIAKVRKSYMELGGAAVEGMRKKLRRGADPWFNRQVLVDVGVVPSAREIRTFLAGKSELGNRALDIVRQVADSVADDENGDKPDVVPKAKKQRRKGK